MYANIEKQPYLPYFNWTVKPPSSANYGIIKNSSGQRCIVVQHSPLKGITSEMLFWWFTYFPALKIYLEEIGIGENPASAFKLWHPKDHFHSESCNLLSTDTLLKKGTKFRINEAPNYTKNGRRFESDEVLKNHYLSRDGWAAKKSVITKSKNVSYRSKFKEVKTSKEACVLYHTEVVVAPKATLSTSTSYRNSEPEDYWQNWIIHHIEEMGNLEHFLPQIYHQRTGTKLRYSENQSMEKSDQVIKGFDSNLFMERIEGYQETTNAMHYQDLLEVRIFK